jgi:hypothetical protein
MPHIFNFQCEECFFLHKFFLCLDCYWKIEFSDLVPYLECFCIFYLCVIRESSFAQVCAGEVHELANCTSW